MPMYRVLRDLSGKNGERIAQLGQLSSLPSVKPGSISVLLQVGAIAEVQPPPLSILPGWATRAKRLEALGIITVNDFVDAETDTLRRMFRASALTIEGWKEEAKNWLAAPDRKG